MEKYNEFIKEIRKIVGLKTVKVFYDKRSDSVHFLLTEKQFLQLDDEDTEVWGKFSMLLDEYDYYHEFGYNSIEVFEVW